MASYEQHLYNGGESFVHEHFAFKARGLRMQCHAVQHETMRQYEPFKASSSCKYMGCGTT